MLNNTTGTLLKDCGISTGSQAANLVLATPSGGAGVPSFRTLATGDLPAIANNTVLGNSSGGVAAASALTALPPVSASVATTISTGTVTARSLAARGADVFNVKDYGALGNGSADDTTEIQAAVDAAGVTCGTVFFPQGHYMLTASLDIPYCIILQGSGRPIQFSYLANEGTILDWVGAPGGTDGITASVGTMQMLRISDMQFQRAPGDCLQFEMVYSVIENVSVKKCGGTGINLTPTGSSYLFTLRNIFIWDNGADGLQIAAPAPNIGTTSILENVYALDNVGTGIVLSRTTSTTVTGSAADFNGESGFYIANSNSVAFIGSDAENNGKSGFNWDTSSGTMTSTIASINNTSSTAGHANYVLAQASTVQIYEGFDYGTGVDPSINALSGSIVSRFGGTYVGAVSHDSTSTTNQYVTVPVSFTPGISFGGATTGITYTRQVGMKIVTGQQTCISVRVTLSNDGSATGAARLTGLPTSISTSNLVQSIPSEYSAAMAGLTGNVGAYIEATQTAALLTMGGAATGTTGLTEANFTNTSDLSFSGCYLAAAP